MNILESGIEVYGVSDNITLNSNYFKEFEFETNKRIDEDEAVINNILSINTQITAGDMDIITTPIMLSNEGRYLSGYKLKVELIIDIKIKYLLKSTLKGFGVSKDKLIKTIYIVLPLEHNGLNMIDLLRKRRIIINSYIEDVYGEIRDSNTLYTNLSAIVVANFIDN